MIGNGFAMIGLRELYLELTLGQMQCFEKEKKREGMCKTPKELPVLHVRTAKILHLKIGLIQ